jgi:hypothetical protein
MAMGAGWRQRGCLASGGLAALVFGPYGADQSATGQVTRSARRIFFGLPGRHVAVYRYAECSVLGGDVAERAVALGEPMPGFPVM